MTDPSSAEAREDGRSVLTLRGAAVHDIPSFYDEINRVFMVGVDWQLGESLDALDDLLYGGYGTLLDRGPVEVRWLDHAAARDALGLATTRRWLQDKLERPGTFASSTISEQLDALERGTGRTYFDLVLEVFADHPGITLTLR